MRYIITLILSTILITSLKAQNDATKQFIRSAVKFKHIVYVDSAGIDVEEMRAVLDKDTIHTLMTNDPIFVITKEERTYINKELDAMRAFVWEKDLIDSSMLVKGRVLNKIFSNKKRKLPKSWGYFHTHYGDGYFFFSKPIFIRNNTYCIFRSAYYCDWSLCGNGYIDIYKNINGKWVAWYPLKAWQF